MGNLIESEESKTNQLEEILQSYRILKDKSNKDCVIYENMYNQRIKVEMRSYHYTNQEQYQAKFKILEKAKTIVNPNIIRIYCIKSHFLFYSDVHSQKIDQFCSSTYLLQVVSEHPIQSLKTYLEMRGPLDFNETELLWLLDCLISAQTQLQKLQKNPSFVTFDDIYICQLIQAASSDNSQIWKIPLEELEQFNENLPFRAAIKQNQLSKSEEDFIYHIYPSPEELINVDQNFQGNPYKSAVFTIGLLLLHLAQVQQLGRECDQLYEDSFKKLNEESLNQRIQELREKFSSGFCYIMENMLCFDELQRPDFIQLNEQLNTLAQMNDLVNIFRELKGKRIQDKAQVYQSMQLNTIHQQFPLKQSQLYQYKSNRLPIGQNAQSKQLQQSNVVQQNIYQSNNGLTNTQQMGITSYQPYQDPIAVTVTESYQNGSRYTGEKLNGVKHGQGRLDFAGGGYYEGGWRDDRMEGKGNMYYDKGQKAYEGEFKNGKFHNFGHLYNKLPSTLKKSFDYRNFKQLGDNWVKYEGDFENDLKHGFGVLYLTNGEKYTGSFKENYVHGYGAFTKLDGETINGYWEYSSLIRTV